MAMWHCSQLTWWLGCLLAEMAVSYDCWLGTQLEFPSPLAGYLAGWLAGWLQVQDDCWPCCDLAVSKSDWLAGWLQVQDEAAGMVVSMLDPQPGDTLLDACAAPGGKTLYAAAR